MIVPGWMLDALLGGFLGGWLWQAWRPSLPHRLYVHLLNTGALGRIDAGTPA
jgi:hypothetical protein